MIRLLLLVFVLLPLLARSQNLTGTGVHLGGYVTNIVLSNLSSGTNDIWLCPTNSKSVIIGLSVNANTASIASSTYVAIAGTYYRLGAANTVPTNSSFSLNVGQGFLAEEGETFAIVTTANGLNGSLNIYVMPETIPVRTVRLLTVDDTVKTLYTCPAGKIAYNGNSAAASAFGFISGIGVLVINDSGSTRAYTIWRVPNGGSPDSTNVAIQNLSVGDDNLGSCAVAFLLPGDTIQIQSNAATASQFAWTTVYESTAP